MSTLTSTRRLPLLLLAFAMTAVLAACGSEQSAPSQPAANQPSGAAFPVTIEHKYGSTEIKSKPSKVVTIGLTDQDAVLALGVKPVGVVDWFTTPITQFPWSAPQWGGATTELVGERADLNLEKIAALRPDVIIAQYAAIPKEQYDTLSKIAPTVAQSGKYADYATPWREMTTTVAKALGEEAKGKELVAGVDKKLADVRQQHPDFAGKTVAVADTTGPGKYAVFAANDPRTVLMTEMGFKVPEQIAGLTADGNPTEFGTERLDLVDVDKLVWLTSDAAAPDQIKAEPLYQKLKVAQEGRAVFLPYSEPPVGAAVTFATVLSIPYAIDQSVPLLAGTAK
ncbi:iron-siderophore ABC transporter substrate-binding protein [Amycolatopsis nigrescens]|uniref:iron-siderophore ABC transporter substrate-binding protein n=1 Tax=Amycolatopsis nigrescens TaxID=381445 RepID=UPI000360953D|nr:iron-siderophore ABC transporter substrate-binding protein [Amycolatopsis nigrescens]